jgi:phage-related holin
MKNWAFSFVKYFLTAIIAFFSPIYYAFLLVIIFVIVDTITGIMKAGKSDIEKVESSKMFRFIPKLTFYLLLVIVSHSANLYVDNQIPFVKLAIIGISWIETKSIDENFREMFGFSFIDKVLEGVRGFNDIKKRK